ncbi:nuclear transport factor 2 family protein [Streptomyces sp. NPDC056656]|uniref:nuclear transport factor 2 family protein n=1 Tax=Streptomyces sp. NPDC056656 TaxID=3345895 RepID=UPI0036A092D4
MDHTNHTDHVIELAAFEAVRRAVGAYAQALDAGRTDDLAELFHPDGIVDIKGQGVFQGREAIKQAFAAFAPTLPQLHVTANTTVTACTADTASATSDLLFLQRTDTGWTPLLVGGYQDELSRDAEGVWRFTKRVATFR